MAMTIAMIASLPLKNKTLLTKNPETTTRDFRIQKYSKFDYKNLTL
nr:hypothetical protein [Mucilaginibacter sp. X5P1]